MTATSIPMPPVELRRMVTPIDADFDHPVGEPVYADIPLEAYDAVFDFGCGCGRMARKLMLQEPRPRRYVGIDIHKGMIDWCSSNLTPVDPGFQFFHHDVWSPSYGKDNSYRLAEPFPVKDGEFTLFLANSVFTHLYRSQTEYYLSEIARILSPRGIAITSWFFFDNDTYPSLDGGPYCLYVSETDPTHAVIYDRKWFIDTVRRCGLGVTFTRPPGAAGSMWQVRFERRRPTTVDRFPLGDEAADKVCGAKLGDLTVPQLGKMNRSGTSSNSDGATRRHPPELFGPMAEIAALKQSWTWRIGRAVTKPIRTIKRMLEV
jgi:SAM-dependent methyltransferase